jgi:Photosynthesis affected mutant 68
MSASWDPDREGSLLGTEEFSRNIDNIKTGLSRSRENSILRDRASEFSAAEYASLERRDSAKEKRQQSFGEKFGEELE